ncbi:hypothetical protein QVD17_13218 [Tagetes erecta]|uniref:Late embryogenesis abundant protein LEA-2 subgroup domain-containing protein n=1 Tax=Tagetes erecta TaxID=13708 RepID=A0AAD8P3C3_TARER|nr:hypothetical protein QVD17_13218 [Tagetes erecta]
MAFREEQITSVEDNQRKRKLTTPQTIIVCVVYLFCFLILSFIAGSIIYILIFVSDLLVASSPELAFTLNNVNLYTFNFSNVTSTLTSNLQITFSCKNIDSGDYHFDGIDVYASYRGQTITLPTIIPPTFMPESEDVVVWSPYLNGTEVPLPPSLASSLIQDEAAGTVLMDFMLTARLSSKVDGVKVKNRLKVNCPSYVMFGNRNDTNVIGWAVKHPFENEGCHEV